MSTSRLEALRGLAAQDPKNTFVRYGLAQELANQGQLEEAVQEYQTLLADSPDYSAAYYHGGQALEKLGRLDEARKVYQQGIEATTRTGDAHTRSELQAALDLL